MTVSPAIPPSQMRLSVAPMMDWTDSHCRVFHRLLAPHARLYSEMVHANAVIHGDRARLLALDPVEHPVALQLGGSEPALLAHAALIGAEAGFDEINLNCGCPSDRVQAGRFGACLMREPGLVAESVAAMIDACAGSGRDVPVTVKCRLGVDDDHDYDHFRAFVDRIAEAGCRTFVIHARNAWLKGLSPKETATCRRYATTGRGDWRERPALHRRQWRHHHGREASAHLEHADGAMLGRAAYHDLHLPPARCRMVWRRAAVRGDLLRAASYVEAQLARGCSNIAATCSACSMAAWRAIPAGVERRRAQPSRLVADQRALAPTERRTLRPVPPIVLA
jgi:tRNA-dihydrouridine synthase A